MWFGQTVFVNWIETGLSASVNRAFEYLQELNLTLKEVKHQRMLCSPLTVVLQETICLWCGINRNLLHSCYHWAYSRKTTAYREPQSQLDCIMMWNISDWKNTMTF